MKKGRGQASGWVSDLVSFSALIMLVGWQESQSHPYNMSLTPGGFLLEQVAEEN